MNEELVPKLTRVERLLSRNSLVSQFCGCFPISAAVREVLTPAGHLDQLPKRGHRRARQKATRFG
jgi:hypothetical protein